MAKNKIILVDSEIRKKLWNLKINKGFSSHSEAIKFLLKENETRNN